MARSPGPGGWLRRLLLTLLLLLAVLPIGVAVWVAWYLDLNDLNDHKAAMVELAREQLGIELSLSGPIRHQLDATRSRLSVEGLRISSGGGGR